MRPATVLIMPLATRRILLLPKSAMYTLPAPSTATSVGSESAAAARGPPSPLKMPVVPVPAKVEIVPSGVTRRTRPLKVSAM